MRCRPSCRNKLTRTHSQPRPSCPAPTPPRPQPHPTPCPSPIARIPSRGIKGNPIHSIPLRAIFLELTCTKQPYSIPFTRICPRRSPAPSPSSPLISRIQSLFNKNTPSSPHSPPPPRASYALPRPSRIALSSLPTTMCA